MGSTAVRRSTFAVPGMDCSSEERLIRMALEGAGVADLRFDLAARRLVVIHAGGADVVLARLTPLGLGAKLVESLETEPLEPAPDRARDVLEGRTLRILLAVNASMFLMEILAGFLAQSTGLLADSLDMLADATVYGLALQAVGRSPALKLRTAHASGWLQAALALGAIADVLRRLAFGSDPEAPAMVGVSLLALAANVGCLLLVARHREGGAHMKASFIFSTNDVLANVGVIVAGALVAWTGSRLPDLAIGAAVAGMVLSGGIRILRLRA